jgi:hypothetical protein
MGKIDSIEEKLLDLFGRVLEAPKWNGKSFVFDRRTGWNNTFLSIILFFVLPLWLIISSGPKYGFLGYSLLLAMYGIVLISYHIIKTAWSRFRYRKPRF